MKNWQWVLLVMCLNVPTLAQSQAKRINPAMGWPIKKKVNVIVRKLDDAPVHEKDTNRVIWLSEIEKAFFAPSGFLRIIMPDSSVKELTIKDFLANRRLYNLYVLSFKDATVIHCFNFLKNQLGEWGCTQETYHNVRYFPVSGIIEASVEKTSVARPMPEKLAADYWQIYTLTFTANPYPFRKK